MFIKPKLKSLARTAVLKANYAFNNYSEVIWLIGDGRSGTTWISSLINHDKRYREMFEPFHPELLNQLDGFVPHQYFRQHESHDRLTAFATDIFNGKFTNARVDAGISNRSFLYQGLLVKDIFANCLSYWAASQFPTIKPVLLIRNPFSVALSKYKKKHWFWVTEPLELLAQPALKEDFLLPFEDVIKSVSRENNYILKQVLIWSIINYVPLRQFAPDSIHVCFYENIYTQPSQEIAKLLQFVRGNRQSSLIDISKEVVEFPSRVAGPQSNLLSGTSPISSWQNEIDPQVIDRGLEILCNFGFESLYDELSMPNLKALTKIHDSA